MRLTVLPFAMLVLPALASAAPGPMIDAACATLEVTCLDRVQVTATRRPESTADVPAATTIITAQDMRAAAPQTVMDALHGGVGTFVQQTTPGQAVVIVRGLKGSEVLHLVDGFRLNNAIFRNAPNQYIALVDAQNIERIEVVRGPSSALYGGDAMGGVVHMLSREPQFTGAEWQSRGHLRGVYASADDSVLGRAEFSGGRDGLALSGGATWQNVHDLRVGGGDTLSPSGFRAHGGDLKLLADVADGHELMFSLQSFQQPNTPRYDALVPGFGQNSADYARFDFSPQSRRFIHARWKIEQPTPWFDNAELHLGQQVIVDDRQSQLTGSLDLDEEHNRDELSGLTGQFGKAIGANHYLSYGFEWYADEVRASRLRTQLNSGVATLVTPRFPDASAIRSWAVFVADDWLLGDALDINSGLRYSRFAITTPATPSSAATRLTPDAVTANVGLRYELANDWKLVSNLGQGFRAPNIFDLGSFGRRPGNRFNIANPNLQPERVTTFDAGFKRDGERMSLELIGFRSHYRDKISSVLTGDVRPDGALVVQSRNVTALDLSGIEAGLRYHLSAPLELQLSATYTRGQETLAAEDYPADRIPPLFGKAGLSYRRGSTWSFEAYALYASAQKRLSPRDALDPRINPDGTAGWVTLNGRIAWSVNQHLDVALRMENLADKRYREHGSGLDEAGCNLIFSGDVYF